jgi:MFS transporter, FHS family, glucose/mannose:H+ symporter
MAGFAASELKQHPSSGTLVDCSGHCGLPGFALSGVLLSFLAAILPAWGYQVKADFVEVGEYFLTLYAGFLLSLPIATALLARKGVRCTLLMASTLAGGGFVFLAFCPPSAEAILRIAGVFPLGLGAGLLNTGLFRSVSTLYKQDRAGTANLASALFGAGCFVTALLVAGTYYAYTVRGILILFAVLPVLYAGFSARMKPAPLPTFAPFSLSAIAADLNEPGIILFALLLFFQFGNEWSLAGWLSLFLVRRLGISPQESLFLLALYWATLLVGRIVFQILFRKIAPALMLTGSVASSLLGTLVLAFTDNQFGAIMGILFVGAGFASVYPIVVEKMKYRFRPGSAGLFDALSFVAITGGLLAPWLLGYLAEAWGIQAVMIVPMLGISVVLVLVLLILLESKLSGLASPN